MYTTEKRKITDHARLVEVVNALKALGAKIVLTQGSYDLVHIGHARYLETAKQKGDVLIVGVDSDQKIQQRKGPERPIVPQEERLEMVLHLRPVDFVVLKPYDAPKWHLIKTVRPDILIATQETYTNEEVGQLKEWCSEVIVLDRMATTTTSAKIRDMQIRTSKRIEESLTPKLMQALQDALKNT